MADAGYGVSAGYGISAAFRKGLSERGLAWAVGVPKVQNVYSTGVELPWPRAATGRPRRHPVPSEGPVPAEVALAAAPWRRVSWRRGAKGPLAAGFAAPRARPAEGNQLRGGRRAPGAGVWLVGERRTSGETKYYLADLQAETSPEELAATIHQGPPSAGCCRPLLRGRIGRGALDGSASRRTGGSRRLDGGAVQGPRPLPGAVGSAAPDGPGCTGTR